jgi:predicted HTH transcriptional regulator
MKKRKKGITIRYTDKEKVLLEYLDQNNNITISKFQRIAGISRQVAEKVLVDLITLQIIYMDITEKSTFYLINPDINSDPFSKMKIKSR